MAKDIKDYLEYSDGTMTQRAADLAHAFANKQTAEELQQKMVDDTAERNDLSDEEIEAFFMKIMRIRKVRNILLTVQY